VLTPTARPLEQLAVDPDARSGHPGETRRPSSATTGRRPGGAAPRLRPYLERQKKPRAFLLVDQFEELFTLCKDEAARAAFIGGLLAAAEGGSATVVVTLRADFYHHCLRYPGLRDALQQRQLIIGAMDEAELRAAVASSRRRAPATSWSRGWPTRSSATPGTRRARCRCCPTPCWRRGGGARGGG
jgi:hypothetical protein